MLSETRQCAAVVLAAGSSSRLGRPKQLLQYQGQTLVSRSITTALDAECSPVIVVLGANWEAIAEEISESKAQRVVNLNWPEGMSSSIRSGVNALNKSCQEVSALLITLVDQPLISSGELRQLMLALTQNDSLVAAAEYQKDDKLVHGVPAVFSCILFPELLKLKGPSGAKDLIARQERASFVPISGAAMDLDTMDDYNRLLSTEKALGQGG